MSSPYHKAEIVKGVYGMPSKIFEEVAEFADALEQGNKILELCELADILGAIGGYVETRFNLTVEDITEMMKLNRKAFESGYRT